MLPGLAVWNFSAKLCIVAPLFYSYLLVGHVKVMDATQQQTAPKARRSECAMAGLESLFAWQCLATTPRTRMFWIIFPHVFLFVQEGRLFVMRSICQPGQARWNQPGQAMAF